MEKENFGKVFWFIAGVFVGVVITSLIAYITVLRGLLGM